MIKENICIVTVCDDHYAVMLAALLKSIEINHQSPEHIDIFIVDDHIRAINKSRLIHSVSQQNISIIFLQFDKISTAYNLPSDLTAFPANIYARLLVAASLPEEVNKFVYLDSDIIVRRDISQLWHTDIGNYVLAAVQDKAGTIGNVWAGIKNYGQLGMERSGKYLNSGLLVINRRKWTEGGFTANVLRCVQDNLKYANFPDQYGLNVIFAENWFELDKRWNAQSDSSIQDPYAIHFTGRKPIYRSYKKSRDFNQFYWEEFYKYLRMTAWASFKPVNELQRLTQKLKIQFAKRFPLRRSIT